MDFCVGGWTVGQAADDLNSSLFGCADRLEASKKQQKHQKKTSARHESDNGKRKVVARPTLKANHLDMQSKNKLSKGREASHLSKASVEHAVSDPDLVGDGRSGGGQGRSGGGQGRNSHRIAEGSSNRTENTATHINGSKRKGQQNDNQIPSKKQKPIQQQISPMDSPKDKSEGEKKKRRKKKKKNSNKKNKYKHLSTKKSEISGDSKVCPSDAGHVETMVHTLDRPTGGNNSDVLPGSQGQNKKKKEKRIDSLVKKQKKCDQPLMNKKYPVHPGVKSKEGKEQVGEKLNVKVLDRILSASPSVVSVSTPNIQKVSRNAGETTLKQRMLDKLKSARFRFLNEQLYNQTGNESYSMFEQDAEAFHVYHQGFQSQVAKWPSNPVNIIIGQLQARPRNLVIADFGCGDAILARSLPNKVHSFDLVAINKHVTACDMAKVPLKKESIDVAVFCLSLMGQNLPDYLREASRVLKPGGSMKVAEVTSRIRCLSTFKRTMDKFGFRLLNEDTTNRMFCLFDFKKCKPPKITPAEFHLEPCLYKRR